MNKNLQSAAMQGRTPGPIEEAAAKIYYERGSQGVMDRNKWRTMAFFSLFVALVAGAGYPALLPLKTIEVVRVNQDESGRVYVDQKTQASKDWGDEVQMAWVSDWTRNMFEVNSSTWKRGVGKALSLTTPSAKAQANDYLRTDENSPPILLQKDPGFIREVERLSVNLIEPRVVLIRYRLISRSGNGSKTVKQFAMTAALQQAVQTSREEIIENPSGLLMKSFSVSDESSTQ